MKSGSWVIWGGRGLWYPRTMCRWWDNSVQHQSNAGRLQLKPELWTNASSDWSFKSNALKPQCSISSPCRAMCAPAVVPQHKVFTDQRRTVRNSQARRWTLAPSNGLSHVLHYPQYHLYRSILKLRSWVHNLLLEYKSSHYRQGLFPFTPPWTSFIDPRLPLNYFHLAYDILQSCAI